MAEKDFLFIFLSLFVMAVCHSGNAFSEEEEYHLAVGLGYSVYINRDYGAATFARMAPEILVYGYVPIVHDFWFRPAARMNFSWEQSHMPYAISIEERDIRLLGEAGIIYDGIVVPSFGMGIGTIFRSTRLGFASPISIPQDRISRKDSFALYEIRTGVGIPIAKGLLIIEPFIRYSWVEGDSRYGWGYGLELTLGIR